MRGNEMGSKKVGNKYVEIVEGWLFKDRQEYSLGSILPYSAETIDIQPLFPLSKLLPTY
jgi:hypothetical protein